MAGGKKILFKRGSDCRNECFDAQVTVNGLTGRIQFNEGKRSNFKLDLLKLKREELRKVGEWTPSGGINITDSTAFYETASPNITLVVMTRKVVILYNCAKLHSIPCNRNRDIRAQSLRKTKGYKTLPYYISFTIASRIIIFLSIVNVVILYNCAKILSIPCDRNRDIRAQSLRKTKGYKTLPYSISFTIASRIIIFLSIVKVVILYNCAKLHRIPFDRNRDNRTQSLRKTKGHKTLPYYISFTIAYRIIIFLLIVKVVILYSCAKLHRIPFDRNRDNRTQSLRKTKGYKSLPYYISFTITSRIIIFLSIVTVVILYNCAKLHRIPFDRNRDNRTQSLRKTKGYKTLPYSISFTIASRIVIFIPIVKVVILYNCAKLHRIPFDRNRDNRTQSLRKTKGYKTLPYYISFTIASRIIIFLPIVK
uniref:Uncharacterized protein n=1 Tax=Rhodnius prolixus TaxID=13249 RepID=T1I8B3_RHOPR